MTEDVSPKYNTFLLLFLTLLGLWKHQRSFTWPREMEYGFHTMKKGSSLQSATHGSIVSSHFFSPDLLPQTAAEHAVFASKRGREELDEERDPKRLRQNDGATQHNIQSQEYSSLLYLFYFWLDTMHQLLLPAPSSNDLARMTTEAWIKNTLPSANVFASQTTWRIRCQANAPPTRRK